jgi:hypothetical protein
MKLRISSFNALLIGGLTLLMFLLWIVSLLVLTDRQNQQAGVTLQHNLRVQVQQLQQNQQLWLQSQYYLLNTLAKSPDDNQNFQSFLWGYYQRNPSIWAVCCGTDLIISWCRVFPVAVSTIRRYSKLPGPWSRMVMPWCCW